MPNKSIKDELIEQGWARKGKTKCAKCGQEVEEFESGAGRKQYFNPPNHPDRPDMYHSLGCGMSFAQLAPPESGV